MVFPQDVDSTHNFYLYSNLRPNVNYTVTAQMRNSVGVGPSASVEVLTPKEQPAAENEQLVLILGTQHGIFELKSLFADSVHLFHSDETAIEGIGIHIEKQLLFVSDVRGSVWRLPIEQETKNKTEILSPDQLDFFPLDISVDWINNQLYIMQSGRQRADGGVCGPSKTPSQFRGGPLQRLLVLECPGHGPGRHLSAGHCGHQQRRQARDEGAADLCAPQLGSLCGQLPELHLVGGRSEPEHHAGGGAGRVPKPPSWARQSGVEHSRQCGAAHDVPCAVPGHGLPFVLLDGRHYRLQRGIPWCAEEVLPEQDLASGQDAVQEDPRQYAHQAAAAPTSESAHPCPGSFRQDWRQSQVVAAPSLRHPRQAPT
ncbi:hypothetical protein YQE_09576, partial [Dendroctonus ponderosae]